MEGYLEITHSDGTAESFVLSGDQVLLGAAPRSGITLAGNPDLESEHLLFAPRQDGCWVSVAPGARVPALVQGQAVDRTLLPWGSELSLGALRMRVSLTPPVQQEEQKPEEKEKGVSLPVLATMVIAIPLLGWLFFFEEDDDFENMSRPEPPELFEAERPSCPESGALAQARAAEVAEVARNKADRFAFHPEDGLEAVRLYGVAEACLLLGGRATDAEGARKEGEALRQRLEEEYKTSRLRFDRAIAQRSYREALAEARLILRLLDDRDGPYTTWLRSFERQLVLRVDRRRR